MLTDFLRGLLRTEIFNFKVIKLIMNKYIINFENFGAYIAYLQRTCEVDGRRLSNQEICRRAHISHNTYADIKKGSTRDWLLTMR